MSFVMYLKTEKQLKADEQKAYILEMYDVCENGTIKSKLTGRTMSVVKVKGSSIVSLSRDGVTRKYSVSRLVAEKYIPNPDDFNFVLHKSIDSDDNSVKNLYWYHNSKKPNKHSVHTIRIRPKSTNCTLYYKFAAGGRWVVSKGLSNMSYKVRNPGTNDEIPRSNLYYAYRNERFMRFEFCGKLLEVRILPATKLEYEEYERSGISHYDYWNDLARLGGSMTAKERYLNKAMDFAEIENYEETNKNLADL
jgi:hypothetical protein